MQMKSLDKLSIEALDSALTLRKALNEQYTRIASRADVYDLDTRIHLTAACDQLTYAVDMALHALIDIAGSLNLTTCNTIYWAYALAAEPCSMQPRMVSNRNDLIRLARAIEESDKLSDALSIFTEEGDPIGD